jgi:hypothetical protein
MPGRADFKCPRCHYVAENVEFPMAIGARASAPRCPACLDVKMAWIPSARFSIRGDGDGGGRGKENQAFTVHRQLMTKDGMQQVEERVAGIADIRRIERESEQRFKDGEGEPLRFRAFSQDTSNRDQGSFGKEGVIGGVAYDSGHAPVKKKNIGVKRHGTEKPKVKVARGAGASPLK